jgi:hypothetical protein
VLQAGGAVRYYASLAGGAALVDEWLSDPEVEVEGVDEEVEGGGTGGEGGEGGGGAAARGRGAGRGPVEPMPELSVYFHGWTPALGKTTAALLLAAPHAPAAGVRVAAGAEAGGAAGEAGEAGEAGGAGMDGLLFRSEDGRDCEAHLLYRNGDELQRRGAARSSAFWTHPSARDGVPQTVAAAAAAEPAVLAEAAVGAEAGAAGAAGAVGAAAAVGAEGGAEQPPAAASSSTPASSSPASPPLDANASSWKPTPAAAAAAAAGETATAGGGAGGGGGGRFGVVVRVLDKALACSPPGHMQRVLASAPPHAKRGQTVALLPEQAQSPPLVALALHRMLHRTSHENGLTAAANGEALRIVLKFACFPPLAEDDLRATFDHVVRVRVLEPLLTADERAAVGPDSPLVQVKDTLTIL